MDDIPLMGKAIAYGATNFGDHKAVIGIGEEYWRYLVYCYLSCVSFVDYQVGRIVNALEKSNYFNNTIIVLFSDHGQNLGEKKHWRKMCLWEESTRVPLCIVIPKNIGNGRVCNNPVSLLDIYPTLVSLCHLKVPDYLDGRDLTPLIENPDLDWPYPVLINWMYKNYAVRSLKYRYILYRDGTEELYNLEVDPEEHINLSKQKKYSLVKAKLKKWIPKDAALPVENRMWKGDYLTKIIDEWIKNDSIPEWLN